MTKILDQFGQPIDKAILAEPQTARVGCLESHYLTPMLSGLTPARLARTLQEADQGNLMEQHRLFADMEERDGHLRAEMDKRKNAIVGLSWDIVPPRDASPAEKAAADWVRETLQDAVDPIEDMLLAMMDATGHGFGAIELEWRTEDGMVLPAFHPRPQEWFRLDQTRSRITLQDASVDGAALTPFGWVMHTHGKAKTGYSGRMGLHRTLVWPFLYKAYALGDFAEFLETYGLPLIVGKYKSGATADEKASLMRAVTALGHDARAIMPAEMTLEINKVTAGGGESSHAAMMQWADKTESKVILGQTLTADSGSGGGGSFALGKVHNEVRHDIMRGDAREVSATLTRDLVYPMVMLNRPGVAGLKRCPRFVLDVGQAEDLAAYADGLPKLVAVGFEIPQSWAQEKLHIPLPKKGEKILSTASQAAAPPAAPEPGKPAVPVVAPDPDEQADPAPVALAADLVVDPPVDQVDPTSEIADQLASAAAPAWGDMVAGLRMMVEQASDLATLERSLIDLYGGEPQDQLAKLMAAAFALAELKGISDIIDEQG